MSVRFHAAALLALAVPAFALQQKPVFDAPVVIAGTDSRLVKTLDLNGDGWTDAMGWWQSTVASNQYATAKLRGWINDGTGQLVQSWETTFSFNTEDDRDPHDGSVVGDLDQDGDEDFVITTLFEVRVYLSNGAAAPTLFAAFQTSMIHGVALGDFDQDGRLDLAVDEQAMFRIYKLDLVNGALVHLSEYWTGWAPDGPLLAAEMTGDGMPDLILGGSRIFPVVGGIIQPPIIHPFPWGFSGYPEFRHDVGDIDGDGDLDVVTFRVASGYTPEYRVLRRTGPSTCVPELKQPGGPARRLFDLDGDGDLDGTCCGGGGGNSPPTNITVSKFRMAWNDGTGSFANAVDMPGLGSTAIAGVADLDHNGYVDLVAGRCVYYARGPITGNPMTPVGTRVQNERTFHDYDWDGDPDVELTLDGVLANLGNGTEVARTHTLPRAPLALERFGKGMPGDWDGDGVTDLLVLLGTQWVPEGLELLRNVGGGTFESKGIVAGPTGLLASTGAGPKPYPTESEDSLAVDIDGDGDKDLVRRTRSGYAWSGLCSSWLRNDGPAGFVFVEEFQGYVILHARDMNGDALPDLLGVTDFNPGYSTHELRLAVGLGGGTFGPWAIIASGSGSRANPPGDQVALADLDLDGDVDVALAAVYGTTAGSRAKVLLNNGDGTFIVHSLYLDLTYTSTTPGAVVVADLNLDGLADLVFGPVRNAANAAAIFLRKPDNSDWEAPVLQLMFEALSGGQSNWTSVLTARDPDGDRDIDLITNRRIENRTFELSDAGSRVQNDSGLAGTGGIVPTLGAVGPFRVGMQIALRLRGAAPGTTGALLGRYASTTPAPFGGGLTLGGHIVGITPITTSGATTDPAGSGSWTTSFTVPAVDAGRTVTYAVRVEDPSAPGGMAWSNTLVLAYGP